MEVWVEEDVRTMPERMLSAVSRLLKQMMEELCEKDTRLANSNEMG